MVAAMADESPASSLDRLVKRYLSSAAPVHRENSAIELVLDGNDWMRRAFELFSSLGPGDAAYICGLQFNPDMDLTGREAGQPDYQPLGELLACLAAAGVDVRVVLAGAVLSATIARPVIGPFHANVRSAQRLQRWRPKTRPSGPPPLRGRVLLDWSGAGLGSNHQKITIVRRGSELTALVGGIDYDTSRLDAAPHDHLAVRGGRWGWHDTGAVVRGPAAVDVWDVFRMRWIGASSLPRRRYLSVRWRFPAINPYIINAPVAGAPPQPAQPAPGVAVQVLRSVGPWYIDSLVPWVRRHYTSGPPDGVHEVYLTLVQAIGAARRFVYIEDQYFSEYPGGDHRFELYANLRAAAARGVKVIMLGSGTRDPAEAAPIINRTLNPDLQRKVIEPLPQEMRRNVGLWRVESLTVHSKLVIVDDVFLSVGSANFFSRSMAGVDTELNAATVTTGPGVRDVRVALWAEHLRTPLGDELRTCLEDVDLALGIFRAEWLPAHAPAGSWRTAGIPAGFAPRESVLTLVGPP
jgi:phosphatidylserine/phosphatidylglycerophosphate/cardiolipin synthase-like enzyme